MENGYTEKIESFLDEYFEYRKAKESSCDSIKIAPMNPTDEIRLQQADRGAEVIFPAAKEDTQEFRWLPKGSAKKLSLNDMKETSNYFSFYSNSDVTAIDDIKGDSISKLLEPFAALEVDKMDYEGSPIYNDLDKDTVTQMAVSAYTNAVLNVAELGDLEAQSSCYSREQMLRALIKELIIKEIFFLRKGIRW